jgi:RNA polymerase sigma-70 factor (family 1)
MNVHSTYSDHKLTALLNSGDEAAFTEIYNRYWKMLLGVAYNHTRDKSDSEEIVQEVFFSLWNKREALNVHALDRYLATAVKFTVFNNYYRKRKRIDHMVSKMPYQESYEIEEEIAARFLQEQIDSIVTTLPKKCRLVFKYSREAGLKNHEIAREMGISEKTVEAHLSKAIKVVKGNLSDTGALLIFLSTLLNKN